MGHRRGQEDAGGNEGVQMVAVQGGIDDLIGAAVGLQYEQLVQPHGEQATQGEQEDEPAVLASEMGDKVQRVVKTGAQQAAQAAHQNAQDAPFEE